MDKIVDEVLLKGAPISSGISMGQLFFIESFQEELVPEFSVPSHE